VGRLIVVAVSDVLAQRGTVTHWAADSRWWQPPFRTSFLIHFTACSGRSAAYLR